MIEDWELIVSSFLSQYGLRLCTREFETVAWDEFRALLAGLSPDTPLGRIVAIRAEDDAEIIKKFSKDQRKIYDDWRKRNAERISEEDYQADMASLELSIAKMFG